MLLGRRTMMSLRISGGGSATPRDSIGGIVAASDGPGSPSVNAASPAAPSARCSGASSSYFKSIASSISEPAPTSPASAAIHLHRHQLRQRVPSPLAPLRLSPSPHPASQSWKGGQLRQLRKLEVDLRERRRVLFHRHHRRPDELRRLQHQIICNQKQSDQHRREENEPRADRVEMRLEKCRGDDPQQSTVTLWETLNDPGLRL